MRILATLAGVGVLLTALVFAGAANAKPGIGDPAPSFRFEGRVGGEERVYSLADYVGEGARKKGVVVAWFPKAFTPG